MRIGIFLKHSIDGFSAHATFVQTLKERFRQHIFQEAASAEEFEQLLPACDLVITWVFKRRWYPSATRLRAIFTPAAGADWIEYDPEDKIAVVHGAFHGPLMAETLCGMMFFFNRRFGQLIINKGRHSWDRNFLSYSQWLGGQSVAIFGYGTIGRACARVLKTFGCTIFGVRHTPMDSVLDKDADSIFTPENCTAALHQADHIVSILPGTIANERFFNMQFWEKVKPGSYFYNLGRGNCCYEEDLLWALDNNKIAGAALDVFDQEPLPPESRLWDHTDVFIMPHASPLCTSYMPHYVSELLQTLKPFLR